MFLMQAAMQQQKLDERAYEDRMRQQERLDREIRRFEDRTNQRNNKK